MTHIFILNLKRSPHRKTHIQKQLHALGYTQHTDYTFVDAVDGKEKSLTEFPEYNSQHRIKYFGRDLQNTEIACVLSHIKALKMAKQYMQKTGDRWAVILEDDIILHPYFTQAIHHLDTYPKIVDCIRLNTVSTTNNVKTSPVQFQIHRSTYKNWFGTWGYAVQQSAIDTYLNKAFPIVHIADKMLFGTPTYGVKVFQMTPPSITITHDIPSDIEYYQKHRYVGIRNNITRLRFRIRECRQRWWYIITHIHEYMSRY